MWEVRARAFLSTPHTRERSACVQDTWQLSHNLLNYRTNCRAHPSSQCTQVLCS